MTTAIKQKNPTAETAYYLAHIAFKQNQLEQVRQWLKVANSSKQHFIYKSDVQKWLLRLEKKSG